MRTNEQIKERWNTVDVSAMLEFQIEEAEEKMSEILEKLEK